MALNGRPSWTVWMLIFVCSVWRRGRCSSSWLILAGFSSWLILASPELQVCGTHLAGPDVYNFMSLSLLWDRHCVRYWITSSVMLETQHSVHAGRTQCSVSSSLSCLELQPYMNSLSSASANHLEGLSFYFSFTDFLVSSVRNLQLFVINIWY